VFETVAIVGIDTPVLGCKLCGALVWYDRRELHADFHAWVREQSRERACA
jgi:hypothetical protein